MLDGFFVSGTDTNIGKTIVSAILVKKLNASYHKPIQCGTNSFNEKDSDVIKRICRDCSIIRETYFLKNPLSPNIASKIENKKIDLKKILDIKKNNIKQKIIIEGAGGLQVPINNKFLMSDLISKFNLPLILVCRTQLGTINHTLLSLEILKIKNIHLHGLVFVGDENLEAIETIKFFGKKILKTNVNVLARLPIAKKFGKKEVDKYQIYFESI